MKLLSIKFWSALVLAVPLLASQVALARPLPNFNVQNIAAPAADGAINAKLQQSAKASKTIAPIAQLHVDERLGVPNLITFATPKAETAESRAFASKNTPEQAARAHLKSVATLYQVSAEAIDGAPLKYIDSTFQGGYLVVFDHQMGGIEIFRESVAVLMNAAMQPLAIRGQLGSTLGGAAIMAKPVDKNAAAKMSSPANNTGNIAFQLTAQQAIASAMGDYGFTKSIGLVLDETTVAKRAPEYSKAASGQVSIVNNPYRTFNMPLGMVSDERARMGDDARAKQVWFRVGQELVPAYYIELNMSDSVFGRAVSYSYVIAADNGRMLFRNDLTADVAFTYRLWAEKGGINVPLPSPHGRGATPHPTGNNDGFQPSFVPPNDITIQNGQISTNDPWLLPDATKTIGNNVEAWANRFAPTAVPPATAPPDLFEVGLDECNIASTAIGDFHACTSGPNAFLYTYDLTKGPVSSRAQSVASVVNMFYTVNWLHDWYYDAGFKEIHGNAQASNYERGGLGNDSIRAQGQDIADFDNANMSTPADGARPRMRMYIFKGKGGSAVTAGPALQRISAAAAFGPVSFDLNATLALGDDGVAPGGDACTAFPTPLTGLIALVDRGTCSFKTKTRHAQLAGAVGIVIANNVEGNPAALGDDATITDVITIPALMVTQADGVALKARLKTETVSLKMIRVLGVDRDGTLDNSVIAHEWGHYISNRLVGNANGLSSNQSRGLGEGWADFHALLMTVKAEDAQVASNSRFSGVYNTVGAFDDDGPQIAGLTTSDAHYFGFRRYPTSIDMAKNPLTFKHMETGVPLPTSPGPSFTGDNAQVHNTGGVWSSMLWGCYAFMLRDTQRLTFDQAQERMKRYIVASYKLTPNDPTLLEARDALFAAIGANDQTDLAGCREAFAVRGAGIFARIGSRTSATNEGVVESYFAVKPANFPGIVQLSQSEQTVQEGNAAVITVARTEGSFGDVSVSYATSNGSALAGTDYTATTGTVTWANGDIANKTFTVLTTTDAASEAPETFTVSLGNVVSAALGGPVRQVVSLVDPGVFPENCVIPAGWTKPTAATASWIVATDTRYDGLCSLKSAPIGNEAKSQIQFSGTFKAGNVTFARRVSSEARFDCLRFLIDGAEQAITGSCADAAGVGAGGIGASGEEQWSLVNVPITAGVHTLTWSYEKDEAVTGGADAAWIDAVNLPIAVATAPAINYSDMWWAGQAENGWGMSIQQHSNGVQFNALYVYDAAGQPRWYVMPGGTWNADFTAYTGALYQPTSSPFTNYSKAQFVVGASVGSATITFTAAGTATLAYTISGVSGTKSIQRQSFSAGTAPFNVGDLWWFGSAEDGWGINFAQQAGTIFGVWYTYGADGKNTWFVLPGGTWTGNTYAGLLYSTVGSPWLGTTYNPALLQVNAVGTLSINFSSANAAVMTYTFNAGTYTGTTQTKAIVRQTF